MTNRQEQAVQLLRALGQLYGRGPEKKRGLVMLLLAYRMQPDNAGLLKTLARAFTDDGQVERALGVLDQLERLEGVSAELLLLKSRALWKMGHHQSAREHFRQHLQLRVAP